MKRRPVLVLIPLLATACGHTAPQFSNQSYASLRSSFVAPAGFTPATPTGPCQTDRHMQCWTSDALPLQAVNAAVAGMGSTYRTTDSSMCGPGHWAVQRKAWGDAHTPCAVLGTSRGLRVVIAAIAFPDRTTSTPGHLVFPPTQVSVAVSS